jgi:two-component system response regulator CssR
MGSDDYISKPFMPRELIIRAKKILERVYEKEPILSTIKIGPYHLFVKERMIKENNEAFDLIYALVQHKGKAFSRDELLNHVWGS